MSNTSVNRVGIVTTIAGCILLSLGAPAFASEPSAESILQTIDRPVGLVHLPRCGDGSLALSLVKAQPGVYVHGQDARAENVGLARRAADADGFLNLRISIDQGGLNRLLPVGNSSDLVVMSDFNTEDMTSALAAEIERVLHPWHGTALLYGVVAKDRLEEWANGFRTAGFDVEVSTPGGEIPGPTSNHLLRLRKPPLPGADSDTNSSAAGKGTSMNSQERADLLRKLIGTLRDGSVVAVKGTE